MEGGALHCGSGRLAFVTCGAGEGGGRGGGRRWGGRRRVGVYGDDAVPGCSPSATTTAATPSSPPPAGVREVYKITIMMVGVQELCVCKLGRDWNAHVFMHCH